MSGNVIGGVVGAVIGFVVGGGPQGAIIGWTLGSAVGGALFPDTHTVPALDDLKTGGSELGRGIPKTWGTIGLGTNCIWKSDLIKEDGDDEHPPRYFLSFALLVCEGEVDFGLLWAGPEKRPIWDGTTLEGGGNITFYRGTMDQMPDPLMEAALGVGNVPAYRGWAYIVFERFPLVNDGNRMPVVTAEVGKASTTPSNLGFAWTVGYFVNQAAGTYVVPTYGSYTNVIVRNLADHSFVANYTADDLGLYAFDTPVIDEDRNRIVYVDAAALRFMNLSTGVITATPGFGLPITGSPTGVGRIGRSMIYHGGLYICLAYPSGSSTGRFTLTAIDPDTLDAVWTTTGDAADTHGVCGPMYHLNDSDPFIFLHRKDGKILKVPINTADFTSTEWGDSAPYNVVNLSSQQDPNTGYIWSWKESAISTTVSFAIDLWVTDLTTGTTLHTETRSFPGWMFGGPESDTYAFAFVPGGVKRAIFCLSTQYGYARDYLTVWDAETFGLIADGPHSQYDWIAGYAIKPGFWDPIDGHYWFGRGYSGYINRSVTDLLAYDDVAVGTELDTVYGPDYRHYLGDHGLQVQGEDLATIVGDLCEIAGLDASQYDVSALSGITVDGFAVATPQSSVRAAIQILQTAFFFDAVESQGKLKFVRRGGAVAATIPDSDLCAYVTGSEPETDLIETRRQMEDELPNSISVNYVSRAVAYDHLTREARRLVGSSRDSQAIDIPIVMSDTKAQEVAETILHQAWIARKNYAFSLPYKYAYLEPTDVVVVRGQTMMITKMTQSGTLFKVEAAYDDFNYVPHVVVTETPTRGTTVHVASETVMELM